MEKNEQVSRIKTEHLQTTEETDPVGMMRYMETEMVNSPVLQISMVNDRQKSEEEEPCSKHVEAEWQRHGQNGEN